MVLHHRLSLPPLVQIISMMEDQSLPVSQILCEKKFGSCNMLNRKCQWKVLERSCNWHKYEYLFIWISMRNHYVQQPIGTMATMGPRIPSSSVMMLSRWRNSTHVDWIQMLYSGQCAQFQQCCCRQIHYHRIGIATAHWVALDREHYLV